MTKVRIFQIDPAKDTNRLSFMDYDFTMAHGGVDAAIYQQIYGGEVLCDNLEELFAMCNAGKKPAGYYGTSMSVSNVIEVCVCEDTDESAGFYFCDSVGFKRIEFDITKTDHEKMLKILVLECKRTPYVAEIRDDIHAMQAVVGGNFEPIYFDDKMEALAWCDEEFLFKGGYEPNRVIGGVLVHGTFFIAGNSKNKYGEGITVSLTDDQIERYTDRYYTYLQRIL